LLLLYSIIFTQFGSEAGEGGGGRTEAVLPIRPPLSGMIHQSSAFIFFQRGGGGGAGAGFSIFTLAAGKKVKRKNMRQGA